MKKKVALTNILTVFFSLIVMLLISSFVVLKVNKENTQKQIKSYLNIACAEYDGTNPEQLINNFKNTDVRITIISRDGEVIIDSNDVSNENHLSRPEIVNLGEYYWRYSDTLKKTMVYVANIDSGDYIRVSIPQNDVNEIFDKFVLYDTLALIVISLLCLFIYSRLIPHYMAPLGYEVKRLSKMVGKSEEIDSDNVDSLSNRISDVQLLLNDKINTIEKEKERTNFIIQYMDEGFIFINNEMNVEIINNKVELLFNIEKNNVINKNYVYLFRNIEIQHEIANCYENNINKSIETEINDRHLIISIEVENYHSVNYGLKGISIFVMDDTIKYKTNKIRQDFFANASHELKSPLTAIIGYQQMIKEGILSDKEEIDDATEKTLKEAFRMNNMIIDMLELSKQESDVKKISSTTNIEASINSIIKSLSIIASKKSIKFNCSLQPLEANISSDDAYHLLSNIIDNAIKYGKENGNINISINNEEKEVIIEDDGIGIAKENQDRVFERFYQVDKNRSKENGGTGLGLAIVKHICIKNDIELSLSSNLNKGTTIKLKFK